MVCVVIMVFVKVNFVIIVKWCEFIDDDDDGNIE